MKYILPGMGANAKMYTGPWQRLKDSHFIDWPKYNNELSISDLADSLIKKYRFNQNDTIIGSSLGGMVGLEISYKIGIKKVYLIGSAINSSEISNLSKTLMPLSKKSIVSFSQRLASFSRQSIQQMYASSETDFIVSMSKAILTWQGFKGDLKNVKRIHGKKDWFITCPSDCEIIEKGGHLIGVSHSQECVNFIEKH